MAATVDRTVALAASRAQGGMEVHLGGTAGSVAEHSAGLARVGAMMGVETKVVARMEAETAGVGSAVGGLEVVMAVMAATAAAQVAREGKAGKGAWVGTTARNGYQLEGSTTRGAARFGTRSTMMFQSRPLRRTAAHRRSLSLHFYLAALPLR